ncbi:MarR family transcriptional regulator [Streptomyces sp. NPDC050121]|uniref:MarR family transcriptional regulator n=1 Tax=Streptomyces sp. NPDC050121 TaxID=3365601 RepID=UPI003797C58C
MGLVRLRLRTEGARVRLSVEASHVTRHLRQLEKSGFVARIPDSEDRRAQLVRLTEAGRIAVNRIRDAGLRGMQAALSDWTPADLRQLGTLLDRLVDDFVTHTEMSLARTGRCQPRAARP